MAYLRNWLLRPTVVTSGMAIVLIAIAGILSPVHQAAASPQSAFGAATVIGSRKTVVVATAPPSPTAMPQQHHIVTPPTAVPTYPIMTQPTAVPTNPPFVPPTPTVPPQSTPLPTPTHTPPTPVRPTPTPAPQPGVLQMSPSGFTVTNCNAGQWVTITLKNVGKQSLTWTASLSSSDTATSSVWLSPTSGTLAAGAATTMQLSGFMRSANSGINSALVSTSYTSVGVNHAGSSIVEICS